MKTIRSLLIFAFMFSLLITNAQIKVASTGNVGMGGATSPGSPLTIGNTSGNAASQVYVLAPYSASSSIYGLLSYANGANEGYTSVGLYGTSFFKSTSPAGKFIGVTGFAYQGTPASYGRSFGVYGVAGNTFINSAPYNGYNYALFGWLSGSKNGAAVFGTTSGTEVGLTDRYAGYFDGKVYINGFAGCSLSVWTGSDSTIKHDIKHIDKVKLKALYNLNAVSYKYNDYQYSKINKSDTSNSNAEQKILNEDTAFYGKVLYGYIAQDVEKVYPNLVYTDKAGFKMINYDSFIPLIIEALKEQNKINDTLKLQNEFLRLQYNSCCSKNSLKSMAASIEESNNQIAILYQNIPNPFSEKTEIKYYLPSSNKNAMLCIYDMQGKQLKCYTVSGQGENSITINGNELIAGMYLYTLIVDGNEVDTKRMILTN